MNPVSPRRVSLFPAFSSLPNPFPVKRLPEGPAPSTPLHLNGKAENQGENQDPNRYDVKHHQAILDLDQALPGGGNAIALAGLCLPAQPPQMHSIHGKDQDLPPDHHHGPKGKDHGPDEEGADLRSQQLSHLGAAAQQEHKRKSTMGTTTNCLTATAMAWERL